MIKKVFSITDDGINYEFESSDGMFYVRRDAEGKSVTQEFKSSFERAIPSDTASFTIKHDLNVVKEAVPPKKALLVLGIILLVLGAVLSIVFAVYHSVFLILLGILFLGGGIALIVLYKIKSKKIEYRVTGKREETLIEVFSRNSSIFSLCFYDPEGKAYEQFHRFLHGYEAETEVQEDSLNSEKTEEENPEF